MHSSLVQQPTCTNQSARVRSCCSVDTTVGEQTVFSCHKEKSNLCLVFCAQTLSKRDTEVLKNWWFLSNGIAFSREWQWSIKNQSLNAFSGFVDGTNGQHPKESQGNGNSGIWKSYFKVRLWRILSHDICLGLLIMKTIIPRYNELLWSDCCGFIVIIWTITVRLSSFSFFCGIYTMEEPLKNKRAF